VRETCDMTSPDLKRRKNAVDPFAQNTFLEYLIATRQQRANRTSESQPARICSSARLQKAKAEGESLERILPRP